MYGFCVYRFTPTRLRPHSDQKNTTHFKLDLLIFCVIRVTGILFIILSFSYYILAHGTCSSFDNGVVKCEILSQKAESCSQAPHTNEAGNSDTSYHTCGCVNTFIAVVSHIESRSFPKVILKSFMYDFVSSDFSQRIERPPISQA